MLRGAAWVLLVSLTRGAAGACSTILAEWADCSKTTDCCCGAGLECYQQDQWYSQCLKPANCQWGCNLRCPGGNAVTAAPWPAVPASCSSTLNEWADCSKATDCCCGAGLICYVQNQWYSQCLKPGTCPGGWDCSERCPAENGGAATSPPAPTAAPVPTNPPTTAAPLPTAAPVPTQAPVSNSGYDTLVWRQGDAAGANCGGATPGRCNGANEQCWKCHTNNGGVCGGGLTPNHYCAVQCNPRVPSDCQRCTTWGLTARGQTQQVAQSWCDSNCYDGAGQLAAACAASSWPDHLICICVGYGAVPPPPTAAPKTPTIAPSMEDLQVPEEAPEETFVVQPGTQVRMIVSGTTSDYPSSYWSPTGTFFNGIRTATNAGNDVQFQFNSASDGSVIVLFTLYGAGLVTLQTLAAEIVRQANDPNSPLLAILTNIEGASIANPLVSPAVPVTPTGDDDGLSGGAIAGIVIGCLLAVLGIVLLVYFLACKNDESARGAPEAKPHAPYGSDADAELENVSPKNDGEEDNNAQRGSMDEKPEAGMEEMTATMATANVDFENTMEAKAGENQPHQDGDEEV